MVNILCRPKSPIVVTGYTVTSHLGDCYKVTSLRLVKSLIKHDMPYVMYPLKGVSDWAFGCSLKPTLILKTLESFNHPVLWIDVDGEVFKYPDVFENPDFDLALHVAGGHWLSGTVYFSTKSIDFVREWKSMCDANHTRVDELLLLDLFRAKGNKYGIKKFELPSTYNKVVHADSDVSDLFIGHYIRPDVAPTRKVRAVPNPEW